MIPSEFDYEIITSEQKITRSVYFLSVFKHRLCDLIDSPPPLSARSEGKVYHFRIQRSSIGAYFVSDKISFATLGELVSYYQKNPRSLGVVLEEPCAQQVGYLYKNTNGFLLLFLWGHNAFMKLHCCVSVSSFMANRLSGVWLSVDHSEGFCTTFPWGVNKAEEPDISVRSYKMS